MGLFSRSLSLFQIIVRAFQPIFANGAEYIDVDCIFNSDEPVGYIGRNSEDVSRFDMEFLASGVDDYMSFEDVGDLFARMVMFGDDRSFLQLEIDQHLIFAHDIASRD